MFARVSTYQGATEIPDEVEEEAFGAVRKMEGNRGVYSLLDRATGKGLSVTLWETEEAMRASEEAANRLREDTAGKSQQDIVSVERYEVLGYELRG